LELENSLYDLLGQPAQQEVESATHWKNRRKMTIDA
jgi:hypothetical protein